MTRPIPLATPEGLVLAYACGDCSRVAHSGDSLAPTQEEALAAEAESSRSVAERCCTCSTCGAATDREIDCHDCAWGHRWAIQWGLIGALFRAGVTTEAEWEALCDRDDYESGLP